MTNDFKSEKLLSIVLTGRNDNYSGNFKYRITTCINYLARNLKELGKLNDVELLVTDWNSEVPLSKVLPLTPDAAKICRFVRVPPLLASQLNASGQVFNMPCASNTAIRRSCGKFIILTCADVLYPLRSVKILFELLEGKVSMRFELDRCLFLIPRRSVPWDVVRREPGLEEWDHYLTQSTGEYDYARVFPGAGVGSAAFMLHSSLWRQSRGINEKMNYWNWLDGEFVLRVTQAYPWMELMGIGMESFEMGHRRPYVNENSQNQFGNACIVHPSIFANDENWGLSNYPLDIETAKCIQNAPKESSSLFSWLSLGHWPEKTSADLVSEMTDPKLLAYLGAVFQKEDVFHNFSEWVACCLIGWHSFNYSPRSYLEFGILRGGTALSAGAASQGLEIYGIDSWFPQADPLARFPMEVSHLLSQGGYQGYLRFVTGDPATAVDRLCRSLTQPVSFDLVMWREKLLGRGTSEQISHFIPKLSAGGALVLSCESKALFSEVWESIQKKFPQFVYWSFDPFNVGLLLAVETENNRIRWNLSKENQKTLIDSWRCVRRKLFLAYVYKRSKNTLHNFFRK